MTPAIQIHGQPIHALLLDMDGVLYHGEHTLPGALDFMQALAHLPTAFVTNNPIRSPEAVADNLAARGFARPDARHVITSGAVTARWLHAQRPGFRYFAIGAAGLHEQLAQFGHADRERADVVVVGEGPGIDFEQLAIAINLIEQDGAMLVSTNPDTSVDAVRDGRHWVLPGGGALVAPIVAATGVQLITIGKPQPWLYEAALQALGTEASRSLMIGDRPDTDIEGAARLGIRTALVRTGRFPPGAPYPAHLHAPDVDVQHLSDLLALLQA